MSNKQLNDMSDTEYLYELANLYNSVPNNELQEHATRLNAIRARYETLERQMAFHFKHMAFSEKYGNKFTLSEPTRKSLIHKNQSPIPMPHIVRKAHK